MLCPHINQKSLFAPLLLYSPLLPCNGWKPFQAGQVLAFARSNWNQPQGYHCFPMKFPWITVFEINIILQVAYVKIIPHHEMAASKLQKQEMIILTFVGSIRSSFLEHQGLHLVQFSLYQVNSLSYWNIFNGTHTMLLTLKTHATNQSNATIIIWQTVHTHASRRSC